MTGDTVAAAAALHAQAGLPEAWDAGAFATLLAMPGAQGCLALDPETGAPVGLALWRVAADEAELLTICVSPASRRQGLGSVLLAAALDRVRARGAERMLLEVAADNGPARSLYGAHGFQACGLRPNYYRTTSGTVDAEIMIRDSLAAGSDETSMPARRNSTDS